MIIDKGTYVMVKQLICNYIFPNRSLQIKGKYVLISLPRVLAYNLKVIYFSDSDLTIILSLFSSVCLDE